MKQLIIDTDCGVDDALALLLALSGHGRDWLVRAITCCRGVTNVQQVTSNVLRIINYVGLKEIPVYLGCDRPLLDNAEYETDFHGADGLGNVSSSLPLDPDQKVQPEHASVAMTKMTKEEPGQLTLLALGPLTNVAIGQRLDPKFSSNLKELVVMGGNIEGLGNQTPLSEFNFFVDPEAAQVVLTEFQCPVLIYPWEPCLKEPLPWLWFEKWISKSTRVAQLIEKFTALSQKVDRDLDQRDGYLVPDLLAAVCALEPDKVIATSFKAKGLAVELGGTHSRGLMVLDKRNQTRKASNTDKTDVTVVTKLNMNVVLELLENVTDTWGKIEQ